MRSRESSLRTAVGDSGRGRRSCCPSRAACPACCAWLGRRCRAPNDFPTRADEAAMSARSMQVCKLGYELAQDLGLRRVEIRWSGTKQRGGFGGWRVEWTDGPTVPRMKTLIEKRAGRFPSVPVADLGYDRCSTNLGEAIALLLYVDRDRSWVDRIECPLLLWGYDTIDSPEQA